MRTVDSPRISRSGAAANTGAGHSKTPCAGDRSSCQATCSARHPTTLAPQRAPEEIFDTLHKVASAEWGRDQESEQQLARFVG